ncbi:MAG: phosphoribosylamine--glycine ligase [Oscillospiraceae bacterium]|nr:phosphoribosylamine--glycine ligase [Oscillospiraceae bacterium]
MKILVIGGGGREHAIIWKLAQSPKVSQIYCAPGNGGIAELAEIIPISAMDIPALVAFAQENSIDLAVVAPDDPLVAGAVDAFQSAGIKAFGPNKAAAIIEGSKSFSKELMKKYYIPTAAYEVFENSAAAIDYVRGNNQFPTVIKADGLALGKGVIIAQDLAEAEAAIRSILDDKVFGDAGARVVIEEFLTGQEVSVLAFTDGTTIRPMVSAQDHKRALDGDLGLNTGGMGTFSPSRVYTNELADECMEKIFRPTVEAMKSEGREFRGCLYFGLILTDNGPKVIEYNCRFGDPETQVVLPRLESDLVDIMLATVDGTLGEVDIKWNDNAAVCVVLASGGYPQSYETGYEISGLEDAEAAGAIVFHAGSKRVDGKLVTAGGRVLGVTAIGKDLDDAIAASYKAAEKISFKDMHYRRDIGVK